MLAELANRYDATGLDVSEQSKKLCESRGLRNVVLADGADMPFEDNKFDVVVTLDTIEHIDDDALTVNQILRVLKPGGVVIANVPAFRWLWGPHDIALHHKRRYTKAEFNSLFKQAGFEVELVSYSVFWLFPIVVLRRMLERFSRGKAKVRMPVVGKWFNRALIRLMDLEGRGLVRHGWPWGSSVVIVAKKPALNPAQTTNI